MSFLKFPTPPICREYDIRNEIIHCCLKEQLMCLRSANYLYLPLFQMIIIIIIKLYFLAHKHKCNNHLY